MKKKRKLIFIIKWNIPNITKLSTLRKKMNGSKKKCQCLSYISYAKGPFYRRPFLKKMG